MFKKLLFSSIFLFSACSTDLVDISNQKWKCNNTNKIQNSCLVSFNITNNSHFPIKSIIRMRAHNRKSVMGSDAIQNIVVGDKILELILEPGKSRHIEQNIEAKGRVTSIIVTATSNEQ